MKYLALLTLVIGVYGCQNVKYPEKPDNLIDHKKMVNILTEAYLMNAARSVGNKTMAAQGIQMDSIFYARFGVDSLQFAQSNAYYASDVNTYITLFQEVEEKLQQIEKDLDQDKKPKTPVNDNGKIKDAESDKKKSVGKRLPNLTILYPGLPFP